MVLAEEAGWPRNGGGGGGGGSGGGGTAGGKGPVSRQVALSSLSAMQRRWGSAVTGAGGAASGRPLEFRAAASKALDLLRQTLQAAVTKDIDCVIKRYLERFFVPAVGNIRANLGDEAVSEEQLRAVCRALLDGARTLYAPVPKPSAPVRPSPALAPSPSELSDSESSSGTDSQPSRPASNPSVGKRKESDSESDNVPVARRKPRLDGYAHKWDPARLNQDTLFIMGSIANKVLGLGQSRGRLYTKHAGLLRYPADSADKEWITNQNLKTTGGGKTYIMVLEDIEELIVSENYRHSTTLRLSELSCFRAPPFMLRKIQAYITRRCQMSEEPVETPPLPPPVPILVPPRTEPVNPEISKVKRETVEPQVKLEEPMKFTFNEPLPPKQKVDDTMNFTFDHSQIKMETQDEPNDPNKKIKTEAECGENTQFIPNNSIKLEQGDDTSCGNFDDLNSISGNFSPIASVGLSSVDSTFWKSIADTQFSGNNKDNFDPNVKVELNAAADLMDADIEFLSGDFCSYAESEADIKKSFDKLAEGNDDIFFGDNSNILSEHLNQADVNNDNSINMTRELSEELMAKAPIISSLIGNIGVDPNSGVHTYVPSTTATVTGETDFQSLLPSFTATTFVQALPSFSQISTQMQTNIMSTPSNSACIPWPNNITQNVAQTDFSFSNNVGTINTIVTTESAMITNNPVTVVGNIANADAFKVTPKNFPTGSILHNAIISGAVANRKTFTVPVTKSIPISVSFNRNPVDLNEDTSITTTKSMIDNTCNSSAMLKQVLTLGSAGVNKTFLSPPMQKINLRPPTTATSTLSASHATLSALLSGIDPSHSDKSSFVLSSGEK